MCLAFFIFCLRIFVTLAGSSGGSWATVVYSYYQYDNVSDSTMLGPIVFPADIEYDQLPFLDSPDCVRRFPNSTYVLTGADWGAWVDAVQVHNAIYACVTHVILFYVH